MVWGPRGSSACVTPSDAQEHEDLLLQPVPVAQRPEDGQVV